MMKMRTSIVGISYYNLLKASLIALRYSIVRKQFRDVDGLEIPIIDYQMQKQKIYQQMCRGLILNCAYIKLLDSVNKNDALAKVGDFSLLKDTHLNLCGHKALSSEWNTYGVVTLIRACGGHGYNNFSGLPGIFKTDFPSMILEGENSILFLQISRDLLKCLKKVKKGKVSKLIGARAYFKRVGDEFDLPKTKEDFKDPSKLMEMFMYSCIKNTELILERLSKEIAAGADPKSVMNYKLGSQLWDLGKLQAAISILINALEG